ncbi:MAG: ferritin-like domain-containing protein [Gammaproteobacteria bacterium]|nr:ferritin-like domain-containing protein [Gammaproteobacteria bacterium]MDH5777176.1 ferritin-like domain-containing protein [Gammaproteobacteria bacterium]
MVHEWQSIFQAAHACLMATNPDEKISLTNQVREAWLDNLISCENQFPIEKIDVPGRPDKPELVSPRNLPKRSLSSTKGRAALIHALCHIEFNAINLAWDAVYRFQDMPRDYYTDWSQVAAEEAYHFGLLREHLRQLGYDYGDFDAHNGLWEMTVKTDFDPMVRMALVPRVLEARGLDVTPGIMAKLDGCGDNAAVKILEIIHRDEVGHVEIGSRWFNYLCEKRKLEPASTFDSLIKKYMKGQLKGPFDMDARRKAGFSEQELAYLEGAG